MRKAGRARELDRKQLCSFEMDTSRKETRIEDEESRWTAFVPACIGLVLRAKSSWSFKACEASIWSEHTQLLLLSHPCKQKR